MKTSYPTAGIRTRAAGGLALGLFILQALCLRPGWAANGQEAGLGETELEKRRKALDNWVFEPVSLENSTYVFHMDRHTSSFRLSVRRSNVGYYSSWNRKGFCSILLKNGETAPVDKVENLNASSDRIRFRAGSSSRELPPIWLEWRKIKDGNQLALAFDVPEESRAQVSGLRLLDRSLWISDSDNGEILLPRGVGELHRAAEAGPLEIRLDRPLAPGGETSASAYSLPVIGLSRLAGALAFCWSDPEAALTIKREAVDDEKFPGRRGIFTSADFNGHSGELTFLVPTEINMEIMETARVYAHWVQGDRNLDSLRFKTSKREDLRAFIGAAMWRPSMTADARGPLASREVRYDFKQLASISRHWKEVLGIDRALVVPENWLATGAGEDGQLTRWNAAGECGGNSELSKAAEEIRSRGHLFGLGVDLDQLYNPPPEKILNRSEAWGAAADVVRTTDSFNNLAAICDPQLLFINETEGLDPGRQDWGLLLASRSDLLSETEKVFGLVGISHALPGDLHTVSLFDRILRSKLAAASSPTAFPLVPAIYGHVARLGFGGADALGPSDAAGFLCCLLYGQPPVYALPPGLYFKSPEQPAPGNSGEPASSCFAREAGWTAGKKLGAHDLFIKNTYEVSTWLSRLCARNRLTSHRFLTADGSVQESFFSADLRVLVNFGKTPYEDKEARVVLPQYGFLVRHPFFLAFHALEADGLTYDSPAFFTVRSLEGKMYLRAEQVRIYQGMAPGKISLGGRVFEVDRELKTKVW